MKNIAIFMSSTFNDMQSERDLIREKVTPELAEALIGYGRSVEFIDLRWGIDTASVDENTANRKILKTCFEEIKNSEPFFIAFLGERYGWVPDYDDVVAALEGEGIPTGGDIAGKSVTELEIECAMRLNPLMERCVFYFRDDVDYGADDEHARMFVSSGEERKKLNELKARITKKYPDRVRTYSAVWNADGKRIEGLDGLARSVIADINNIIVNGSDIALGTLDPISESINVIDGTVGALSASFSGRDVELDRIAEFVRSDGRMLVLSGSSGSGKSALLAKVTDMCGGLDAVALPFFVGADERSGTAENMMELTCARISRMTGVAIDNSVPLAQRFNSYLNRLALDKKVVLIVDAVNQFAPTEYENKLKWLNLYALGQNVKVIMSMTPDYRGLPFARALGAEIFNLDYFSAKDVRAVSERYFTVNHKQASAKLLSAIADNDGAPCRKPIYLLSLLQQLNNLDREDFSAIKSRERTGESAADAIVNYLVDVVKRAPVTLDEQLDNLLSVAAAKAGEVCRLFASAIALSRRGITERLMQKICATLNTDYDGATFSYFRRMFKANLLRRENGAWDFSHALVKSHFAKAVDDKTKSDILNAVIACLDDEPDESEFKRSEYAFYLTAADRLDLYAPFFAKNDAAVTRESLIAELQNADNAVRAQKLFSSSEFSERIVRFMTDTIGDGAYSPSLAEKYALYAFDSIYSDEDYASDTDKLLLVFGLYRALGDVALSAGYHRLARDYLLMAKRVGEKCGASVASIFDKLSRCYFALGAAVRSARCTGAGIAALEKEYEAGTLPAERLLDAYIAVCEQKLQAAIVLKKTVQALLEKARNVLDGVQDDGKKEQYAAKILIIASAVGGGQCDELVKLCRDGENDRGYLLYAVGAFELNTSAAGALETLDKAHELAKAELQADVNVKTLKTLDKITELKAVALRTSGKDCEQITKERAEYLNTLILLEPSYSAANEYIGISRGKSEARQNAKAVRKKLSRGVSTAEHKVVNKLLITALLAVGAAYMLVMPVLFSFLRGMLNIKKGASPFEVFAEFYVQAFLEAFFVMFLLFGVYGVMQIVKPNSDYAVRRVWAKRVAVFGAIAVAIVGVYAVVWNYFGSIFLEKFMYEFWSFELPYMFMLAMELLILVLLADLVVTLLTRELPSRSIKDNCKRFVFSFKRAMLGYGIEACVFLVDVLGMWALYDWYSAVEHYGFLLLGQTVFYAFTYITVAALVAKIVYLTVMYFVVGKKHGKNTAN